MKSAETFKRSELDELFQPHTRAVKTKKQAKTDPLSKTSSRALVWALVKRFYKLCTDHQVYILAFVVGVVFGSAIVR